MENYCFAPVTESNRLPLFHHFLAGTSPENSPEYPSPATEEDSSISDCESGVTGTSYSAATATSASRQIFEEDIAVELEEGDRVHDLITRRLVSGLAGRARVEAVHRRNWAGPGSRARLESFQAHCRAVACIRGGKPNVKFGWWGGSRERVEEIMRRGFGFRDLQVSSNGAVILSSDDSPAPSVEVLEADEDGLRHVLLCRVVLGRSELVKPGSGQFSPSSDEFDSGLDEFENPKKYIIWSNNMNSHILPEYVVSFRVSDPVPTSFKGYSRIMESGTKMKMPTSPWISFPALISVLAKFLPQNAISLINKHHKIYKERRMTRAELIQKVRQIAGDKLLIAVIKSCKGTKDLMM